MAFPFGMQLILQRNYDTPVEVRRHRTPARAVDDFPGGRYPPRWKSMVMEGAESWVFVLAPGTPCDLCGVAIFHHLKLHLSYKVFYAATYYVICPHCRRPWYPAQWGPPEGRLRRIEVARMVILRELGLIYDASPQEIAMLEGILPSIPMALIAASVQYVMKKTHRIVDTAREKKKRRGAFIPTQGRKKDGDVNGLAVQTATDRAHPAKLWESLECVIWLQDNQGPLVAKVDVKAGKYVVLGDLACLAPYRHNWRELWRLDTTVHEWVRLSVGRIHLPPARSSPFLFIRHTNARRCVDFGQWLLRADDYEGIPGDRELISDLASPEGRCALVWSQPDQMPHVVFKDAEYAQIQVSPGCKSIYAWDIDHTEWYKVTALPRIGARGPKIDLVRLMGGRLAGLSMAIHQVEKNNEARRLDIIEISDDDDDDTGLVSPVNNLTLIEDIEFV